MRILVVDDDRRLVEVFARSLAYSGFTVDTAMTGADALVRARGNEFAAIILDLGLPDRRGLDVLRELRTGGSEVPVLVLGGTLDDETIVATLDAGADDYVVKPVTTAHLAARVRALLRRSPLRHGEPEILTVGSVHLDRLGRTASVAHTPLWLSPREFGILEYLMLHVDTLVTREDLLEHVWGMNFDPGTNVVDVQVGRARRKLAAANANATIETRRGLGFFMRNV